jgi:hypothetical protein
MKGEELRWRREGQIVFLFLATIMYRRALLSILYMKSQVEGAWRAV